jgi:hypothetical membrane protein
MPTKYTFTSQMGAILWILSVQYYAVQLLAAAFWSRFGGYSWSHNTISDLANTHCGVYGNRLVCSPLHIVMNVSFIILGLTIIGGAVLLRKQLADNFVTRLGFSCVALSGVGSILVGLFPENTVSSLHIAGAALPFLLGNAGMVILGFALTRLPPLLRIYTVLSGAVGLAALALFMTQTYEGIGIGGMERAASYPLTIWMMVFGSYLLLRRLPANNK